MQRMVRKIGFGVAATAFGCLFFSIPAFAVNAKFKQLIVPMDCVFQQVNDGTGTVIYLTPAACGQIVTPPPSNTPAPTQQQVQQQFNPNRTVFFVPKVGVHPSQGQANEILPWQPIATIGKQQSNNQKIHINFKIGWALTISAAVVVTVLLLVIVFAIL